MFKSILLLLSFFFCLTTAAQAGSAQEIRIGLIDTFDPDFYLGTFVPTMEHLQHTLKDNKISVVEIDPHSLLSDIEEKKPHFLLSSAGSFVTLINSKGAQQIATVRRSHALSADEAVSSVFITRKDRTDIRSIEDLKDKVVTATDSKDFDGYLLALGEVAKRGFNPDSFFKRTLFTNYQYPDVSTYIKVGEADAGILGPCQLEDLVRDGIVKADEFRVLDPKRGPGRCLRSTEMYPDAVFFSLDGAPSGAVKAVTLSLLSMPKRDGGFEWIPAGGFLKVFDLMKDLKLGPYAHLRETTVKAFVMEYRTEFALAAALLFALIIHIIRVNVLVNRRTNELRFALAAQRATERRAQRNREKLDRLEKSRVISQMSSIFAHEVKQPITNMIYYSSGLKLLLSQLGIKDSRVSHALEQLCVQARRTSDIVEHVRSYAKHTANRSGSFELTEIVERAVSSIRNDERHEADIRVEMPRSCEARGDSFEIELVILNLLKNAVKAAESENQPQVEVLVEDQRDRWLVTVSDNGPEISDERFAKLGKPTKSDKQEGLGIGLSIAVEIIENHGAHLNFQKRTPHGLIVSFNLNKPETEL